MIYLQIKGLFSFPSTAGARQTERSLSSYFPLGPGAEGHLRPRKPCLAQESQGDQPQNGLPRTPAPGFVPKPRAWQVRNRSLSCCRPGASGAKVSSPTPNMLTSTIIFWIRVWRHCLGSGLQFCLTLERRRKGPFGPANLAAIKDIHYAIANRLRHVRYWVIGAAPQPVLKDRGHLLSWTLATPRARSKPSQLNSRVKAKEPSRTQEHPLPVHRCALTPWKTHLGPAVQKAKATADSRKEAGKTPASPSGPRETLGDAWSHTPGSGHTHSVPMTPAALPGQQQGQSISLGMWGSLHPGAFVPS